MLDKKPSRPLHPLPSGCAKKDAIFEYIVVQHTLMSLLDLDSFGATLRNVGARRAAIPARAGRARGVDPNDSVGTSSGIGAYDITVKRKRRQNVRQD